MLTSFHWLLATLLGIICGTVIVIIGKNRVYPPPQFAPGLGELLFVLWTVPFFLLDTVLVLVAAAYGPPWLSFLLEKPLHSYWFQLTHYSLLFSLVLAVTLVGVKIADWRWKWNSSAK